MSRDGAFKRKQQRIRQARLMSRLIQAGDAAADLVTAVARGELTPEQAWTRYRAGPSTTTRGGDER